MSYFSYGDRGEGIAEIAKEFERYFGCAVHFESSVDARRRQDARVFYCYPLFDVAFTGRRSKEIDAFIRRGFCGAITDWKSVLRNLYYFGSRILFPYSAAGMIVLDHPPEHPNDIMIFPNNKKIKIVDFKNGTITNILKHGYGRVWYEREVALRRNTQMKHVLPLKETEPNSYTERMVRGYTFARLPKAKLKELRPKVYDILCYISSIDADEVTAEQYLHQLDTAYKKFRAMLNDRVDFSLLDSIWSVASDKLSAQAYRVPIGLSHGDIQRGNVFYEHEADQIWILDWETYATRSIYYDALSWHLSLKNKGLQLDAFNRVMREGSLTIKTRESRTLTGDELKAVIAIFILEDLLLILDETSVLPKGAAGALRHYTENSTLYCNIFA